MAKHSTCTTGICENDMRYPGMQKKHNRVDGYIIIHKLPKDRAVRVAWINTILKCRKQTIQESLHTFVTASLLD